MKGEIRDVRVAKASAKEQLSDIPGVTGFGIGQGTVRVYVVAPELRERLPEEIDGIPLEIVVTGEVRSRDVIPTESTDHN